MTIMKTVKKCTGIKQLSSNTSRTLYVSLSCRLHGCHRFADWPVNCYWTFWMQWLMTLASPDCVRICLMQACVIKMPVCSKRCFKVINVQTSLPQPCQTKLQVHRCIFTHKYFHIYIYIHTYEWRFLNY